tara:strand:+ start:1526 stop:2074 length:549 start_codon:yes stop_codon:yes gene_type:complete
MLVVKKILITSIFFLFSFSTNAASDKLNKLFDDLYYANNLNQAEKIEDEIWESWTKHPNNEYLTNKLENGTYSMYHQQYKMALKLFTDIINEDPKWAEGWNKRATLLFIMGNYEKSLDDIEKVLDLEPRHFGALSGRAQIYLSFKQYEKAINDLEKAQSIYPLIKSGENIKLIKKIIKDQQI